MAETKIVNLQISDNLNATTESVKSLKAQLREAQNDVTQLSEKFGATSKEAINAAKKAGILKDAIGDAKALTDAFNPDAKFKALSSSLSGVAGGFAAVQGGMALFGSESENVEKTLLKVQSAMALSQGLQSVGESIDSFKQLGAVLKSNVVVQKVLTVAQAAYTTVVGASTGALKILRIALASTGIGAIVVGLGLLIANFDKVKKAVFNLIPGLAQVGEFFGEIIEAVTDFIGVTSEAERALDSMLAAADKSLANNKKFLQQHGSQLDEFTKKKIDAKNKYLEAIKEEGNSEKDRVELGKELNRQLAAIDKEREDSRVKKNQEAADKIKKDNEKLAADKKAADEKALADKKSADAAYLKSIEDRLKNEQSQIDAFNQNINQLDAIQKEQDDKKLADDKAISDASIKIKEDEFLKIDGLRLKNLQKEKEAFEAKLAINNATIDAAQGLVSLLASLGEKNKGIQKAALLANSALSIAQIIINTNVGSSQEVATKGIFGLGTSAILYAKAAINIGSVIAATAKGLKGLGGGSAGGGGNSTGGSQASGATTPPAAPQFNVVGTSGVNQIAQGLGNQSPVQAYVVGSQVTTQQALDRNIVRTATLGG